MDVTLVVTHRCNLDCGYCYAGEHHRRDITADVVDRGVDLLFADGAREAQLGFFGGEPLLAFEHLERAVARARCLAGPTRRLQIQCTTNGAAIREPHVAFFAATGTRVTVSIDGVAEAHDLNRPRAGGGSSFAQVHRGLRMLIDGGLRPDAMMVITPQTVPHVYRSVSWLWSEGVQVVRANLELSAPWGQQERDELSEQLTSVGVELCARRRRGEEVRFAPLDRGMAPARPRAGRRRHQIVIGTTGNLYPCAPMVGEDRDGGPEDAVRIGHLDDGPAAAIAAVSRRGAGCAASDSCACAAYLETGDRDRSGPVGLWYAAVCREIGRAVAAELGRGATPSTEVPGRRVFLIGMAAAASGVALAVPLMMRGDRAVVSGCPRPEPAPPPEPAPLPEPPPEPPLPGQMLAPAPEPERPVEVDGDIGEPPEVTTRGDIGEPVEITTLGEMAAPPPDVADD